MPTKFDLATVAALGAAVLLIEASHRTEIVPPERPAVAAAAPDPCFEVNMSRALSNQLYLQGGFVSGMRWRPIAVEHPEAPGCKR